MLFYNKMKVIIKPSTRKDKKLMAIFENGRKVHFGQKGYEDYTIHRDDERKERYLKRHSKISSFDTPYSAGSLSRWILWNKTNLEDSIRDYKKRFGFK